MTCSAARIRKAYKAWEEDQLGRRTDYTYDDAGHMTSVTLPAVWDEGRQQTSRPEYVYRYDAYGNLHEQQDAEGRVTTFTYDNFNRRWPRTLPAAVDADGNALATATETTLCDDLGREQSVTDFAGTVKWDVYNSLGRLSDVFYFASGIAPNDQGTGASDHIAYQYDAMGRQWQITDTKDNDHDGLIESADGDYVRTTTNGYDAENHLTLVDSPEGVIQYAFDPATGQQTDTWTQPAGTGSSLLDREQATTWTHYDYDQIGRLLDAIARRLNGQSVNLETDYAYLATGQLAHQATPNGVTSDWSFDQLGRLVQLAHKTSSETLATFRYTRDAVGQIKHTDESGPAVFGGSRSVDYQYDAINRLTEEVRHEGDNSTTTTDYFFDLVGNRLRQVINAVTTSYSYNDRDEKLTETAGGTTTKSYYDANGSLKQTKQGETVTAEYRYDLRNKMIQAAVNGVVVKYVYDQDGLQVRRTIGTDTDVYLQDKQNPTGYSQVLEHWRNGALYRTFVIGRSILAQVSGPTLITAGRTVAQAMEYLLADGHGDTRAILDATGQPITGQIIAYDTYGKVISGQTSILTPIQYAMQWIDDTTGLSFNRARWYDLAGRWTQRDTYQVTVGDYLNSNAVVYCAGSPIIGTDPLGLFLDSTGMFLTTQAIGTELDSMMLPVVVGALLVTGAIIGVAAYTGIPIGATGTAGLNNFGYGDRSLTTVQYYTAWPSTAYKSSTDTVSKAIIRDRGYTTKQTDPENIPVYYLPEDRFSEVAYHDMWAISSGWPAFLHYNGGGKARIDNRKAALDAYRGRQKREGEQLDEYPYAATQEGGAGASVWPLDGSQNMAAGGDFGNFVLAKHLGVGSPFVVVIVPTRPWQTYTN